MKEDIHETNKQENELTDPYQNGQSEAEKLMRRHLQTPGDVITDEELKALKIGTDDMAADTNITAESNIEEPEVDNREPNEKNEKPVTPWDVLDA